MLYVDYIAIKIQKINSKLKKKKENTLILHGFRVLMFIQDKLYAHTTWCAQWFVPPVELWGTLASHRTSYSDVSGISIPPRGHSTHTQWCGPAQC